MRYLACLLICFIALPVFASAKIMCYSNGKNIYTGKGLDVAYDSGIVYFKEKDTNDYMLIAADCVVRMKD